MIGNYAATLSETRLVLDADKICKEGVEVEGKGASGRGRQTLCGQGSPLLAGLLTSPPDGSAASKVVGVVPRTEYCQLYWDIAVRQDVSMDGVQYKSMLGDSLFNARSSRWRSAGMTCRMVPGRREAEPCWVARQIPPGLASILNTTVGNGVV